MTADSRDRFEEARRLIEAGGGTPQERLTFAYGVISQLLDDIAWQRSVADGQEELVRGLTADLEAARTKLEMLRLSNKATSGRVRKIVMGVLTTLVMVSEITGFTVKDLVAPESPAAPLVVVVDQADLQELGLAPQLGNAGTQDRPAPSADVRAGSTRSSGSAGPGETAPLAAEQKQESQVSILQNLDGSIAVVNHGPGKIDRVRVSIVNGNNRLLRLQEIQGFPIDENQSMVVAHEISEGELGRPIVPEEVGVSVVWQDLGGAEHSEHLQITVPRPRP